MYRQKDCDIIQEAITLLPIYMTNISEQKPIHNWRAFFKAVGVCALVTSASALACASPSRPPHLMFHNLAALFIAVALATVGFGPKAGWAAFAVAAWVLAVPCGSEDVLWLLSVTGAMAMYPAIAAAFDRRSRQSRGKTRCSRLPIIDKVGASSVIGNPLRSRINSA